MGTRGGRGGLRAPAARRPFAEVSGLVPGTADDRRVAGGDREEPPDRPDLGAGGLCRAEGGGAAQHDRAQRTKAVLPFWLYGLGPSINHRAEHQAKEGMVRPVDDPIWSSWFPPNGWGCKCWLRQITRAEANRRGVTPPFEVPTRTFRRVRDDGQVERVQVPEGIDPGWQTNPGLNRSRTLMVNMADRLISVGEPAARALMSDLWKGNTPEALASLGRRVFAPVAVAPARVQAEMETEALLVMVGSDTLAGKVQKHGAGSRPGHPRSRRSGATRRSAGGLRAERRRRLVSGRREDIRRRRADPGVALPNNRASGADLASEEGVTTAEGRRSLAAQGAGKRMARRGPRNIGRESRKRDPRKKAPSAAGTPWAGVSGRDDGAEAVSAALNGLRRPSGPRGPPPPAIRSPV